MLSSSAAQVGAYASLLHASKMILGKEGIRGLYAGLVPSLIGVSHGALQFMAYEELKKARSEYSGNDAQLNSADYLVLGGLSKAFAGTLTHPFQMVRTRMQSYGARNRYGGIFGTIGSIWKTTGLRGYYRGLSPNLIRVLPSAATTFFVYEHTKALLSS